MKNILFGAIIAIVFCITSVVVYLASGALDFAADVPHSDLAKDLIGWARDQSITRSASDIVPPGDLSDPARVRRGAGNYDAMCANCHLAPGITDSEIRKGLYPVPPSLVKSSIDDLAVQQDIRRFWIIKHGIKGSGMPAWSKGGVDDQTIWDMTAFLKVLPGLSSEEYRHTVNASDGHAHGGAANEERRNAKHDHPNKSGVKPHAHNH